MTSRWRFRSRHGKSDSTTNCIFILNNKVEIHDLLHFHIVIECFSKSGDFRLSRSVYQIYIWIFLSMYTNTEIFQITIVTKSAFLGGWYFPGIRYFNIILIYMYTFFFQSIESTCKINGRKHWWKISRRLFIKTITSKRLLIRYTVCAELDLICVRYQCVCAQQVLIPANAIAYSIG